LVFFGIATPSLIIHHKIFQLLQNKVTYLISELYQQTIQKVCRWSQRRAQHQVPQHIDGKWLFCELCRQDVSNGHIEMNMNHV
jgi:hypothetical protein